MAATAAAGRTSLRDALLGTLTGRAPGALFGETGPVQERTVNIARGIPAYGDISESAAVFTVGNARSRIPELISGAFKASSLGQLATYFMERFITPEIRSYGADKGTLHLRDQVTGGSTPGASVHPMLSERGLRKLSGGPAPSAAPTPDLAVIRKQDAIRLQFQGLPPVDYESIKTGVCTALSDKHQIAWTVAADGTAYFGRSGVNPRKPLECLVRPADTRSMMYEDHLLYKDERATAAERSADKATTLARAVRERAEAAAAIVRPLSPEQRASPRYAVAVQTARETLAEARSLGLQARDARASAGSMRAVVEKSPSLAKFQALAPDDQMRFLSKHYVFDARLEVRTAILMRTRDLTEATRIHPSFSAAHVASVNGSSYAAHCAEFHRFQTASRKEQADDTKVVNFEAAVAALRDSRAPTAATAVEAAAGVPGIAFGGVPAAAGQGPRSAIVIVADDTSPDLRICRYKADGAHTDMPQMASMHQLAPGEYRFLVGGDPYDSPSGYMVVDEDQGVTYQDAQRREHNLDGPSHQPSPSNKGGSKRWAIEGEKMDQAAWEAQAPQPPVPEPVAEESEYSSGFGFGSPG